MMTATAEFSDVGSLASNATVEMAGVSIGHVIHIKVDGARAKLTLRFPKSVRVPAGVVAQVRRGAILGPQLIELVIPPNIPAEPLLADKATITVTTVRPDLEDLIKSGTDLIGALSTSQLAQLLQEGARGFGGEGGTLHQVIDNLNIVLSGYASRTAAITSIVKDLNTLTSSLGPAAEANAQAIANLAQAATILDAQRVRLTNLLSALDTVSQQGVAILSTQLPQIADQLVGLRNVTQAVANQQHALGVILTYLEGHNAATGNATVNNFIQVLNDFIVCGLGKAGGEDPASPLNACTNVPSQAATP
jgi:phospholipid/cholesterol/gamma-HCH transport system substrate-binding protein